MQKKVRAIPANRNKSGRFEKGQSGNPSGRPKIPPEVKEAIRAACPEAVELLIGNMHHKNPKIAMWAITEVLDRGYGKPTQEQSVQMEVTGLLDVRAQIRDELLKQLVGHGDAES